MKSPRLITVLLAEDHMVVREGLRKLLEAEGDIEVIGDAADGRQAVAMAGKLRPAVVVMDIAMPLLNGLEATRRILRRDPEAKVLILSAHNDDAYLETAAAAGAAGYLLKQSSARFLADAIREVREGNTVFSPACAGRIRKCRQKSLDGRGRTKTAGLSSRETEVLQLIAEGEPNKQIAAGLGVSVKTVEKHRAGLMRKLDIHDTASLTRYAIAAGLVESGVRLTIV